jgi:hypothetical protein
VSHPPMRLTHTDERGCQNSVPALPIASLVELEKDTLGEQKLSESAYTRLGRSTLHEPHAK